MRSLLYWLAKLLGDINAVAKNRIGKRIGRRVTGKWFGKLLNSLFR